jgi:non-ribosomal peptide synthetase component E (peptide arylation enzyme)
MGGYHNKAAETELALCNGEIRPNGHLTVTGCLRELIIRGGRNIAPAELRKWSSAVKK